MNDFNVGLLVGVGFCVLFGLLVTQQLKATPAPPAPTEVNPGELWTLTDTRLNVGVKVLRVTDDEVTYYMNSVFHSNTMDKSMFTSIYKKVSP